MSGWKSAVRRKKPAKKIPPMYKHQKITAIHLDENDDTADFSSPGVGKTRAHLESWAGRRRNGGGCLLVLCPKSIMQVAWGNDLETFFPGEFTYSIAYASNRASAFNEDADVYITNIDAVKWLAKQKPAFFKKFDEIIIDESTSIKNPQSQRSKAAIAIRKRFNRRRILTGTPNSRTILDIWNQIYFLDEGQRLGKSFYKFRNTVAEAIQVGPRREMVQWVDKEGAEEAVAGILLDIVVRHNFEDVIDVPENIQRTVYYTLPKRHMAQYLELKEHTVLELQDRDIVAVNAAVLTNKLLQLASGAVYDGQGDYALLDPGRYELIVDLVEERDHSLTFFNWQHQKNELTRLAKNRGLSYEVIDGTVPDRRRTEIVEAYQEGVFQTLFLHPQSAAHGLTLIRATRTIWSSPVYQPDIMRQGVGRNYRAGQTQRTENIMICAKGTLEHKVYAVMQDRMDKMDNLLGILQE